jgi:predicted O-methyltransferase YrrM
MNIINYIKFGIKDPFASIKFVLGGKVGVNLLCLRRIAMSLGCSKNSVKDYINQILADEEFNRKVWAELHGLGYIGWIDFPEGLYTLMRILKPEIVVETGVAAGVSSAYILKALEDNDKGELFSIDLPNHELEYFPKLGFKPISIIPQGKEPGFAVPAELRYRWHLKLGKSKEILPQLLQELGSVDSFLHDSEHTYGNMMFEYKEAWKYLRSGGLLLSDNIFMNSAFDDFSKLIVRKPFYVYFAGWGCIVK